MQSEDVTFVHLALWILAQFSNGSKTIVIFFIIYFSPCIDKRTRKLLRHSVLMNKVVDLRARRNSIEISQLADSAFNNLKVSAFRT